MQDERFCAGPSFVVTNDSYLDCPGDELDGLVGTVMNGCHVPEDPSSASTAAA